MEKLKLQEHINMGQSQREMAKALNISQSTVKYWLKKYELSTKGLSSGSRGKTEIECLHCGETDEDKFYGLKRTICGKCHNKYTIKKGQEKKDFIIKLLGGECKHCGYKKYNGALDLHHINPEEKDPNFKSIRGWGKEKIIDEVKKCILLCANCHREEHYNLGVGKSG